MFFIYQSLGELSFLDVSDISCDAAIDMVGQPADGYGTGVELHHSTIQVNNQSGGNGPDAVQTSQGATVHDNVIYGATGTLCAAPNHQDGIQQGGDYHLIYNNVFYDLANSSFDSDWNSEPCGFMHAWNNIIAASSNHSTSGGIWVGEQSGCTHEEDVKIINNVFVGFSSVPALYIQNGLTSTIMSDTLIENNIFYDDGSPIEITNGNYNCTTDVIIDYNNVNAGTAGGTSLTCDGTSFSQAHGQSGAPVFVSYSLRNQSNDYHLQSNSAADIGKGVNLATPFPAALTDKDDVARPGNGGGAWDIGAYMYSDDPPPGPPEGLQADVR
jgi:hypothetical protein